MRSIKAGRLIRALATTTVVASEAFAALGAASASAAGPITVCPAGSSPSCAYTTIQDAINNASDGETILVGPGAYSGALDVNESVTIKGDGVANTIITAPPALTTRFTTSGPNDPIIYADSPNVTIEDLTVDGEDEGNPGLNYRFEGIAAYNDNLTVDGVTVMGIADNPLDGDQSGDGIYAAADDGSPHTVTITDSQVYGSDKNGIVTDGDAGLTVDLTGNSVIAAGGSPIGSNGIEIYNDYWVGAGNATGPSGTIADNTISGNVCTVAQPICGSDLLSDGYLSGNNDVGGDSAGLLLGNVAGLSASGNTVTDNDVGVWSTTAAGSTASITGNTIEDNLFADVLAEYGPVTISDNTIGGGPESASGLAGVLVANYDGDPSSSAPTITANTISGTGAGIEVAQGDTPGAPLPDATIGRNAITGNTTGIENLTTASVSATNNWFGCNGGPGASGCDTVTGSGASHVTASPFLVLALGASPASINPGGTATVTASLRQNSASAALTGAFPSGLATGFATTAGSVDGSATMSDGLATTTLSGTPLGSATVTGTVDNQSAATSVSTVSPPTTTTSSTSTTTVTSVSTPVRIAPVFAFLAHSGLSLLVRNPGSELTVFCVDGCTASVVGQIALTKANHKHTTLMENVAQLTLAAGGSSVYTLSLISSQRAAVKHALSATLTLNVSAKDDLTGTTTTASRSYRLTRS
jgi:hypothetical protein